jgi:hypothetical protein
LRLSEDGAPCRVIQLRWRRAHAPVGGRCYHLL